MKSWFDLDSTVAFAGMRRSREIASMRYPMPAILKAVLWGLDRDRNEWLQAGANGVMMGCDLLIPANVTIGSQSNHEIHLPFYIAFTCNRRSGETFKLKASENSGIK